MKIKAPLKLGKYCKWLDEVVAVGVLVFVGGLIFRIDSQNNRIHELIAENGENARIHLYQMEELKQINLDISERAEKRLKRIEKLDEMLKTLQETTETLQQTIENQHALILDLKQQRGKK